MNHRYYIITSSNGNVTIPNEYDDLEKAIVGWHQTCAAFWNAHDVIDGIVQLVYSADLAAVTGYTERIHHEPVVEEVF